MNQHGKNLSIFPSMSHMNVFSITLAVSLILHCLSLAGAVQEVEDGGQELHREVRSAVSLGKRLQNNLVAELGKRPKQLYSFGIGKRSISPQEMQEFLEESREEEKANGQESSVPSGPNAVPIMSDNHEFTSDKRDPYAFGLGKRTPNNPYAFGMGKRDPYAFGLGKRDPYAFGLGKRDPYAFGLGKRDPYAFGLGKRDPYAFGLGKRDPYAFGLGKRDPYAFGLGKRDPYAFGLGKRDPYGFGLGKRKPYSMGLGR